MRIILLAGLVALAASKAIHNKGIGCGGSGGLSCIHPVPVPQSIHWYGYPWAYSAYQTPVVNTPASYEPLCAILNGAFHTFANIGEFIEAVRNGYDFKFYCNGPCPPTQIACSATEPFCASDGVITKTFHNTCDLAKERIATGRVWIQVSQGACPNESQFDTSAAPVSSTPVSSETAPATDNASSSAPDDIASGETSPASNASSDSSAETSLASNASSDNSAESSPASNASSDSSAESSPASNASSGISPPVSSSTSDPTTAPSESPTTSPIPSDSSPVSSSTLDPTTNDVIFVRSSSTWPASASTSDPTVNDVIANESSSTATPSTNDSASETSDQSSSSASETHYESFSAGEANFDVFSEPQSSAVSAGDVVVNPDSVTINPAIVDVSALNDIQEAPSDDTESLQSSSISAEDIIAALLKSQPRWPAAAAGRPAASKISFRNNIGNSYDIYAEGNVYNNNGKKQRNARTAGISRALSFLAKFRPHN